MERCAVNVKLVLTGSAGKLALGAIIVKSTVRKRSAETNKNHFKMKTPGDLAAPGAFWVIM